MARKTIKGLEVIITDLEKLKTVLKNKNIEVESENDAKIEYT